MVDSRATTTHATAHHCGTRYNACDNACYNTHTAEMTETTETTETTA